jgi:cell division protein FtsB
VTQAASFGGEVPHQAPPRHRKFPLVAVMLLTALAITLAGIFPFRQMIAQQRQVDQTQARLETLLEDNQNLEETVAALNAAPGIERLAREQYGLVRPGETGYTVETPAQPAPAEAAPVVEEVIDDRSLLERFWDFLTGRDLVPDE